MDHRFSDTDLLDVGWERFFGSEEVAGYWPRDSITGCSWRPRTSPPVIAGRAKGNACPAIRNTVRLLC